MYKIKDSDLEHEINSMKGYFHRRQEIDKELEIMIKPFIEGQKMSILDACCGVGHISHMLSQLSPESTFFGVDQEQGLISVAEEINAENKLLNFKVDDILNLPIQHYKEFDIAISWKSASWFDYYEDLLRALFLCTRKHIFLSSLFYDGDIDFDIKVREYQKEAGKHGFNKHYNIYSLPRFKDYAYQLGAKNIETKDFKIQIDIPRGPIDEMGTYTVKDIAGNRIQISGGVIQYWKIIRIDLPDYPQNTANFKW